MTPDEITEKLHKQEEATRAASSKGNRYAAVIMDAETIGVIVRMFEKQIAKKPTCRTGWPEPGRDTADGNCPCCGMDLICSTPRFYSQHKYYCRDCGQAIDWRL